MTTHERGNVLGDARKRLDLADEERDRILFDLRPECHTCSSRKPHLHGNGQHSIHMADYLGSDPT